MEEISKNKYNQAVYNWQTANKRKDLQFVHDIILLNSQRLIYILNWTILSEDNFQTYVEFKGTGPDARGGPRSR